VTTAGNQLAFSRYFALGSKSAAFFGCCCCSDRRGAVGTDGGLSAPILSFKSAINFLPMPFKLSPPRRPVISSTSLSPDGVRGWKPVSFFVVDEEEGAPDVLLAPDALACLLLDPAKISCWIKTAYVKRKHETGDNEAGWLLVVRWYGVCCGKFRLLL